MSDAWDRAVEAGARAIYAETYAHDLTNEPAEVVELYRCLSDKCLRAAFPILGADMVEALLSEIRELRHRDDQWQEQEPGSPRHNTDQIWHLEEAVILLRARIEQMAEAL
jgi:hypothetical protein